MKNSEMKLGHTSFVYFCAVFGSTFFVDIMTTWGQNSFNAVTSFNELGALYLRMRIREPHLEADATTDIETKRRVCHSVATSSFFALAHRESLDMDALYLELKTKKKKEKENRTEDNRNIYYKALLQEYEKKSYWGHVATYRYTTRLTTFSVYDDTKVEEYAFGCAVRHCHSKELVIFYISDPYDMNTGLNVPAVVAGTDRRRTSAARFVCVVSQDRCDLAAIAEEPAKAFPSSDYDLEAVYLSMRRAHSEAETASDDPVCGLSTAEKLRVCASVMGSSNFANKVKFRTIDGCEKKKVSLGMLNDREEAAAGGYYEWMLSCSVEPITLSWSTYHVSRAYQSDYAIVYTENYANYYRTQNCEYYIKSIHANVGLVIDDAAHDDQLASLNLTDMLNNSYLYDVY